MASFSFCAACLCALWNASSARVKSECKFSLRSFHCLSYKQRCICIMDPLKGPSLQISSCSSVHTVHRPIGALPNTSSYFMRNIWGTRESLSFYCPDRPLYIENVALRAIYSLSMLEHVHCTVNT
jgi:hypothetical protein